MYSSKLIASYLADRASLKNINLNISQINGMFFLLNVASLHVNNRIFIKESPKIQITSDGRKIFVFENLYSTLIQILIFHLK